MRNLFRRFSVLAVAFLMATALLSSDFSADPAGAAPNSSGVVKARSHRHVRPVRKTVRRKTVRRTYRPTRRYRVRPSRKAVRPRVARPVRPRAVPTGDAWARLRQCESGGNYRINTGNGFYGAYQFHPRTWRGLGFPGLPHQAPPEMQDEAARKLQARSGWGQWPACSRRLGLR
ncbi:MAG TPA: transglycosylase family protein [Arenibaculum sp.]|nr:transglycosylase family protein [Arenibaculum sp.]